MPLKIKLLSLSLLYCISFFAQPVSEKDKIRMEIATLFSKADKSNPQHILTYKIDGKIGFVDARTNRKILDPTSDLSNVSLFRPTMYGIYKEQYVFSISSEDFSITVKEKEPEYAIGPMIETATEQPYVKILSSKEGFSGFTVDSDGKLASYSDLYDVTPRHAFNVRPFLFEGRQYAIASKKAGADGYFDGIIDTNGTPLPHFNFTSKCMVIIKRDKDDMWFVQNHCGGRKGSFASFKGKIKLKDEIVGYAYTEDNLFKYNHNHTEDWNTSGILDTEQLEWVLKPQTALQIVKLDYTSKKKADESQSEERPYVTMYFLVKEGNKEYYMDFKMKKHLPADSPLKQK